MKKFSLTGNGEGIYNRPYRKTQDEFFRKR